MPRHPAAISKWTYQTVRADVADVLLAFQKKSTQGIKTPKHEIDLIKDRLKELKEMLE